MRVVLEKRQVCLQRSLKLCRDFNLGNIHSCLGEGVRSEKASNTRSFCEVKAGPGSAWQRLL